MWGDIFIVVLVYISLMTSDRTLFHLSVGYVYVLFGKMSILFFYLVYKIRLPLNIYFSFHWVVCSLSIVLDIKPLTDTWSTNIFSHFVGYLFTLLMVLFVVQPPRVSNSFSLLFSCQSLQILFFDGMLNDFVLSNTFNVLNVSPQS